MTLSLGTVNKKDVKYVWNEVEPLINKALSHTDGRMLSSDVLHDILTSHGVLWVGFDDDRIFCAGTTEIIQYPQKRILRIITFASKSGHDYESWKDFIHTLEEYGKCNKCTSIEAWTRKGLARKLKWDNEYSVITKNI